MSIKLSLKTGQGQHFNKQYVLDAKDLFADDLFFFKSEPPTVNVQYQHHGSQIVIKTVLTGCIWFYCARCLDEFPHALELRHSLYIDVSDGEWVIDEETKDMRIIDLVKGQVDISELMRQLIVENVPLQPLCSKECQGLCPRCGQNLNEAVCQCSKEATDPRWYKLEALRKDPNP